MEMDLIAYVLGYAIMVIGGITLLMIMALFCSIAIEAVLFNRKQRQADAIAKVKQQAQDRIAEKESARRQLRVIAASTDDWDL